MGPILIYTKNRVIRLSQGQLRGRIGSNKQPQHKPLASVAWFVPEISYFHMPPQSDMKPIEIYLGTQRCILLTQKLGNVVSSANFYKRLSLLKLP